MVVVALAPRFFPCRAAQNFIHVEGSGLLRESAIEPHEADRLFQLPEVLAIIRSGMKLYFFIDLRIIFNAACLFRLD
jgi:hypothetical protein